MDETTLEIENLTRLTARTRSKDMLIDEAEVRGDVRSRLERNGTIERESRERERNGEDSMMMGENSIGLGSMGLSGSMGLGSNNYKDHSGSNCVNKTFTVFQTSGNDSSEEDNSTTMCNSSIATGTGAGSSNIVNTATTELTSNNDINLKKKNSSTSQQNSNTDIDFQLRILKSETPPLEADVNRSINNNNISNINNAVAAASSLLDRNRSGEDNNTLIGSKDALLASSQPSQGGTMLNSKEVFGGSKEVFGGSKDVVNSNSSKESQSRINSHDSSATGGNSVSGIGSAIGGNNINNILNTENLSSAASSVGGPIGAMLEGGKTPSQSGIQSGIVSGIQSGIVSPQVEEETVTGPTAAVISTGAVTTVEVSNEKLESMPTQAVSHTAMQNLNREFTSPLQSSPGSQKSGGGGSVSHSVSCSNRTQDLLEMSPNSSHASQQESSPKESSHTLDEDNSRSEMGSKSETLCGGSRSETVTIGGSKSENIVVGTDLNNVAGKTELEPVAGADPSNSQTLLESAPVAKVTSTSNTMNSTSAGASVGITRKVIGSGTGSATLGDMGSGSRGLASAKLKRAGKRKRKTLSYYVESALIEIQQLWERLAGGKEISYDEMV